MTINFQTTIPIFRIFSIEKAREFYCDWLGFTVDWEHRFDDKAPLFMQVSRGGLKFFLSEHHGSGTPGTHIHVDMTGVAEFHSELMAKGYGYMRPGLEETEWGATQFNVLDPFSNRIIFNEEKSKS